MKNVKKSNYGFGVLTREEYLRQQAASGEPLMISLKNNYAFKKVFKNPYIMKGFVMSLLKMNEEEITCLEIIDPVEEGEAPEEKEGVLDIKVHLNNGQKINVEMQNRRQEDWIERTLFYNCRMFVADYKHGTPYGQIEPCVHVGISDFNLLQSPGFHHCIRLLDDKTQECYSSKIIFHVIELKKINETLEKEQDDLYRWTKMIAADDWETLHTQAEGNPYMEEVVSEMYKMSKDEMQRYLYLREQMALTDEASRIRTAKEEGRQEVKAELISKKLAKGKPVDIIAEELEESLEVVLDLIQKYNLE